MLFDSWKPILTLNEATTQPQSDEIEFVLISKLITD